MAQRRMFSKDITGTDAFLEMPVSSQLLYFHLGMEADDDGFVGSPKKISRIIGFGDDDLKILATKRFILVFPTGVVVIKHWKINNYIQSDRYHETKYLEEKKSIITKDNGSYTECIQDVSKVDTEVRLEQGKVRQGKSKANTTIVEATPIVISYGNEDINWVLNEFKKVFGMNSQGNTKKDRFCAKHLLNNYTKDQIHYMMQYCTSEKYAPNVGSVEKLWYKRDDIIAGIRKMKVQKINQPKSITI